MVAEAEAEAAAVEAARQAVEEEKRREEEAKRRRAAAAKARRCERTVETHLQQLPPKPRLARSVGFGSSTGRVLALARPGNQF